MSNLKDKFSEFDSAAKSDFKISIPKSFLVLLMIIICMQILSGFIIWPTYYWPLLNHFLMPLSFAIGGTTATVALLLFVNAKWSSIRQHILNPTSIVLILLSIFLYLFMLPFVEMLGSMVPVDSNEFMERLYREMLRNFEGILDYKLAGFITVCILAPFFEEILFRGILLRGLLQYGVSPIATIILSSFLFGLAHLNPWQFVGAGFLGAIFGFVYYRTRSLWLCMFLHGLNNTISYIYMIKEGSMEGEISNSDNLPMIAGTFFLAVICGWTIYKLTQNKPKWN